MSTATTNISGLSILGFDRGAASGETFHGVNPAGGELLEPAFHSATEAEVDRAVQLAELAFADYRKESGKARAAFLRKIAEKLVAHKDAIIERAPLESALPPKRIEMEIGRASNQMKVFADLVEAGWWVDARIDRADPDRKPVPKPDVRSMKRPLGPVAVFGASNFPVAFSVAGGDAAAAFAAGCTVVCNAHQAHPGTAELVGHAVNEAVRECGLPEGMFSLLFGKGYGVGAALVKHPLVRAVGFTGSLRGGRALMDLAAARPNPIPVYAEMGSVNPVFVLPGAMAERGEELVKGLHGSATLGVGQFCTNPGVVVMRDDDRAAVFARRYAELMNGSPEMTIRENYSRGVERLSVAVGVETLVRQPFDAGAGRCRTGTGVFKTSARDFLDKEELAEEVFGPSTLLVTHGDRGEMLAVARSLQGQLTATIHGTEKDLAEHHDLIDILETKVGRIAFNGFPTGVEVCHAMVHGGPYPATSDGRSTSVGTRAIDRFARPVCYQDFPDAALPEELKDGNPLGVWRLVDGAVRND
jgi:NADP-dependent aldehyde dehydrogenase